METARGADVTGARNGGRLWRGHDLAGAGLIAIIFATEAVIGILLLAVNPQYPLKGLHVSDKFVGLAISLYGVGKMPGQPLSGWLIDRLEPRGVLIVGIAVSLPLILLMERAGDVWLYVGVWALFGLSLAVVWPSMYAVVGARFHASRQARLLALVSAGQIGGTAVGAGVGAVIIDKASFGAAFTAALVLDVVALVLTVAFVPGIRGLRVAQTDATRAWAGKAKEIFSANVVLLIGLIVLLSIAVAMLTPDLKPYSEKVLQLQYSTFVLLVIPAAVVGGILLYPSGIIADRLGRNAPILVGLLIFAVSLLALTTTRSSVAACLCACAAAAGYVLALPALSASLLDVSNAGNRGLLTGVSTSIQAIGLVAGPAIGGLLADGYGPLAPFRVSGVLVLATCLVALMFAARTRSLYRDRLLDASRSG